MNYDEFSDKSFFDSENKETEIIPIIESDDSGDMIPLEPNEILPILPLRNMVLFPHVMLPISVARPKSLKLVRSMFKQEKLIGVCTQRDKNTEEPEGEDLYNIGVAARIVRIFEMPDNSVTVILEGQERFEMEKIVSKRPYLKAIVNAKPEANPQTKDKKFIAIISNIKDMALKIIDGNLPAEAAFALRNIENPFVLLNYICVNFKFKVEEKQRLLSIDDFVERAYALMELMNTELQMLEIKRSIQDKAKEDIDRQQREYFLQQQIQTIQKELGGNTPEKDINDFRERAKDKKWSEKVAATFEKELKKLERMHPSTPDYSVQLNYVETMLNLPWNEFTADNFDLKRAQRVLDKQHYGMENVKERILEYLAVLKLKGDMKSPIICLYGSPGIGKTSLGQSIADALGRKYARISLGGLHDEAEIRGHRRTYIGAMPGRIIENLKKVQSSNPVFVLDEIDKVTSDYKGDPSSALLEVLDPEQNNAFHDNFLDIDYDLSHVLFIATANNLGSIPKPLLDRMELIEMSGYLAEEKVEIAHRHLVPKELKNHGLTSEQLELDRPVLRQIIEDYTRESGVRELDRQIAKLIRKVALKISMEKEYNPKVTKADLKEYLGVARYSRDEYEGNDYYGVVTGLAWTQVGGEILYIESSLSASKAPKLTLTGNLGDVMKESAIIALEYIKSHAEALGINPEMFEKNDVHIHVPEGAIPKDGPSAGITMTTALASLFTQRKVRKALAMTGEMTLRGKVLPVGGIKEKILAAKRAGIKEIMLCEDNRKDIEEIKEVYLKGLQFHYVKDAMEVLDYALLKK